MYKSCFFKHCSSYVETCTLVEFQHWTLLKLQHALRLIIMFYTFSLPPHLIVPCVGRTGFGCAYMPFGSGGSIIQMLTQHLARFKAHVHDQYIKNEVQGLVHSTKRAFLVITTITVLHDFNKKNDIPLFTFPSPNPHEQGKKLCSNESSQLCKSFEGGRRASGTGWTCSGSRRLRWPLPIIKT